MKTEKTSDIRVKIRNWVYEEETGQDCSDWFTIPISPNEFAQKIKVPEKHFNIDPPPYEITAFDFSPNITIEQLNKLCKSNNTHSPVKVKVQNRFSGESDWFNIPVNYDDLVEQIGVAPLDYKITDFEAVPACLVKELNQLFSPGSVVKVNRVNKNSETQKKDFPLSRKTIKNNASMISARKKAEQQKMKYHKHDKDR